MRKKSPAWNRFDFRPGFCFLREINRNLGLYHCADGEIKNETWYCRAGLEPAPTYRGPFVGAGSKPARLYHL